MTRQSIDRALFERLRLKLIEFNLLPDSTLYSDSASFEVAKETLRNLQPDNQIVDLKGVASPYSKNIKTACTISIIRKQETDGTLKVENSYFYEPYTSLTNQARFKKYKIPVSPKNIQYEIRIICNSISKERILMNVLDSSLGSRKNIHSLNDNGAESSELFLLVRNSVIDTSSVDDVIEWLYNYTVIDAWVEAAEQTEDVSALENITLEVGIQGDTLELVI